MRAHATSLMTLLALAGCQAPAPLAAGAPSAAPAMPVVVAAASPTPAPLAPDTAADMRPGVPVMGQFLLFDDFEHGTDRWQLTGGNQAVAWRLLKAHSCTGDYVMHFGHDDQSTFTEAPADAILTLTRPISLAGASDPVLTYTVKGMATPSSAVVMQPELRHPHGDWLPMAGPSESRYEAGYTRYVDLRAVVKDDVELRFRVHVAAGASATAGMYLDDVGVVAVEP